MADFTIRDATTGDIPVLLALWRRLEDDQGSARIFPIRPDAPDVVVSDFKETIESEDGRLIVAEDETGIIAMATVWFWESKRSLDPMPIVDFSRVVVHPDHRSRGIGMALIDEAEGFGRTRGARYLQAHFFSANDDGRRFWDRRGFVPRYEARVRPILDVDGDR